MAKGKHFIFDEAVNDILQDFCNANFNASEKTVVQIALRDFIENELDRQPETRKRFDELQLMRNKNTSENVHVMSESSSE
jgi:hypothetical protein